MSDTDAECCESVPAAAASKNVLQTKNAFGFVSMFLVYCEPSVWISIGHV